MQHEVSGYVLEESLYEIGDFVTYGARHVASDRAFLARAPRREFPALADVHRLQHELELLSATPEDFPGVLRPLLRIDDNRNSYVIYEPFSGRPLASSPSAPWSLKDFLPFARALLGALASCHERGVIHCCIDPRTVLWDRERQELLLTHFVYGHGPATVEPAPDRHLTPFSAPEQTRQLSSGVDRRSDLYSAGAVLYWALTGQPPFASTELLSELAHQLVAREPTPASTLRPDVPPSLAELLDRLLAKSPAERVHSAAAALEALEVACAQLGRPSSAGPSSAPLLGAPRLQGRSAELETLRRALAEAADGSMRVAFVSGAPGSGKSRLGEELCVSLGRADYLVAGGKFDQYRQQRPYSALLGAMSGLFARFLSASDAELAYWRARFEEVDPNLSAVLAEQIPELQHILEKYDPPPRLGPAETQNRFQQAFRALLEALCAPDHPLVLTIDDLQWTDDETVALLTQSFIRSRTPYLLLILAYRPQEAAAAPCVKELLERHTPQSEGTFRRIEIEPLSGTDISALCEDIVSPCLDGTRLCALVQRDCRGNPLFALEIIKHLRQTGGLKWTAEADGGAWRFEPVATRGTPPDNVVDFVVSRIDALAEPTRRALMAASCLGHSFDVESMQLATGLAPAALHRALADAQAEGMIVRDSADASAPSGLHFTFYHDRIQQAAHTLCSQREQERLHLVIGRGMLARIDDESSHLFGAVEHLNQVEHLLEAAERARLVELDVRAGRLAKEAIAYRTAAALFARALDIASREDPGPALRFEALLLLAESYYLCADFEPAEATFEQALALAQGTDQQVEVHRTKLVLYQHQQRYQEAINLGLRALALLGVKLPERPSSPRLATALARTMLRLRRLTADELVDRPDRADERDRAILHLLVLLWTPTFWINQQLNALVVLKLIDRTMKLGNTPQAPMAYVCFGILNHVLFKRHQRALEFGNLAVAALEASALPFIASRVRFLALTFFGSLQRENRANVEAYEEALSRCLGSGEHVFAGHTIDGITTSLPIHGFRLADIERRLESCRLAAERISSEPSNELIGVIRAWCRALAEGPDSRAARIAVDELRFDSYVGVHRMLRMATAYLWDDDATVLELFAKLHGNVVIQSNPLHASFYALFAGLSLCRSQRPRSRGALRKLIGTLERFERIFSPNFRSSLLLLRAEAARRDAKIAAALEDYHRAILEASERGHDLVHAMACERLATLHEARGDRQGHEEYLRVAAHSYGRFGAAAKVSQLVAKHPGAALARTEPETDHQLVDLRAEAVMRAAYAIAEETRSDRLAHTLLSVVTAAAGAQRAFLLKQDALQWMILASWSSDRQGGTSEPTPLEGSGLLAESAVRYVARTRTSVQLHDAADPRFEGDPYVRDKQPRSVLCLPLLHRGELLAVLYLENSVCADVFTSEQRQLAIMLGHQAAIAMTIADYHKLQIDALQAKINPHFLHNALSVIAQLVISQPKKAEAAVLKLSSLYRYVLNSSADQVVSLEKELSIVREYLTIEEHRFGPRLRVRIEVEGPVGEVDVPALILQPLVENAVRHGVAHNVNGGTVSVRVEVGPAVCRLRVADDGPGWRNQRAGSGFGLKSVLGRLKLLYRDGFDFSIDKTAGVTIDIVIPRESPHRGQRAKLSAPNLQRG